MESCASSSCRRVRDFSLHGAQFAHALAFLGPCDLVAARLASQHWRLHCDWDALWRTFCERRCWGGLLTPPTLRRCDAGDWKNRYRAALEAERRMEPSIVSSLRAAVPGCRGQLVRFISAKDEEHRLAALCALRHDPILADDVDAAIATVRQLKQLWRDRPDEAVQESSEWPWPPLSWTLGPDVMPLDSVKEDEDLDARLVRLRTAAAARPDGAGTCRPLLDGLVALADSGLDAAKLTKALRVAVGSVALCATEAEARVVACEQRCNVVCCGGKLLVEYCPCSVPQLVCTPFEPSSVVALNQAA
eukprot:TRINITY_DN26337_c0_g1_i1.p1 TRINITY_DN26337_c0_g1~~TRINITY_DN26337_c0_g1_i1.p1  ORF type:complete len:304 (+),score=58.60 TRINITY_DN26337_c0_g1_i1:71-982(+)